MKKVMLIFFMLTLILSAKDYTKNLATRAFINKLVKKYHYKRTDLNTLFSKVKVQKTALRAFTPRKQQKRRKDTRTEAQKAKARELYRKYGPWERYSRLKLNDSRVKNGIKFVKKYENTFETVEKRYGVPKEYIAAIIGIESNYGRNVGKYPVFDTLTTLAFERNRRNKFFKNS